MLDTPRRKKYSLSKTSLADGKTPIYVAHSTKFKAKTYPQNFCMSPNLFKLAWMKDPYGYMNLPEYGFPQGPYSPARAISKIGVYFGSKFSNCHIGLRFNLRSISFNV